MRVRQTMRGDNGVMEAPPVVAAAGLVVRRGGRTVVDVPRLEVRRGDVLGIVGPNGAGKSTLLLALLGLIRPRRGAVMVDGETLDERRAATWRRRTALVLQEPLLLDMSVLDNVAAPLRFRGVAAPAARAQAHGSLQAFRAAHLAQRPARALSQGEARRVSLARAFAASPEVLFLDEPFASLDAPTRHELLHELAGHLRSTPRTVVFVSHDMGEVAVLARCAAVMLGGRLAQVGATAAVLARPATAAVARVLGYENVLLGWVEDGRAPAGRLPGGAAALARVRLGGDRPSAPLAQAAPAPAMRPPLVWAACDAAAPPAPGAAVAICLQAEDVRLEPAVATAGEGEGAGAARRPENPENLLSGNVSVVAPSSHGGARVLARVRVGAAVPGDVHGGWDGATLAVWGHLGRDDLAWWHPEPGEPVTVKFSAGSAWTTPRDAP